MRTGRDALRDALPAIEAVLGGKRVRWVSCETGLSSEWSDCPRYSWWRTDLYWEIEPEPKPPQYREMTAHEWFHCWGRVLKNHDGKELVRVQGVALDKILVHTASHPYAFIIKIGTVMDEYTWEDGTPCGVLVE